MSTSSSIKEEEIEDQAKEGWKQLQTIRNIHIPNSTAGWPELRLK